MLCPFCKEEIQDGAIKCKHCGSMLNVEQSQHQTQPVMHQQILSSKMSISQLFFSFEGRIPRSTYWLKYYLPFTVLLIFLLIFDEMQGTMDQESHFGLFSGLFILTCIYPSAAINAKRCHDVNSSAWLQLVLLIPIVGLWAVGRLAFMKGTTGQNRYGEDPLT